MSLTALLLFTLPNAALGEEGDEGCEHQWYVFDQEGAYYLDGVGCVIPEIREYCKLTGGDCISWDQVLELYKNSSSSDGAEHTLTCATGSTYTYRWDRSDNDADSYMYFDADGFADGLTVTTFDGPYCCINIETITVHFGDPYATCIEPTDTGEADTADTPKTGPCGGGSGGSAAVVLFAASSLLTARRRRQP
jgi:hypothetical protein